MFSKYFKKCSLLVWLMKALSEGFVTGWIFNRLDIIEEIRTSFITKYNSDDFPVGQRGLGREMIPTKYLSLKIPSFTAQGAFQLCGVFEGDQGGVSVCGAEHVTVTPRHQRLRTPSDLAEVDSEGEHQDFLSIPRRLHLENCSGLNNDDPTSVLLGLRYLLCPVILQTERNQMIWLYRLIQPTQSVRRMLAGPSGLTSEIILYKPRTD